MPNTPKTIKPKWIADAHEALKNSGQIKEGRHNHANQEHYNSKAHKNQRSHHMKHICKGLCEMDLALGKTTDITGKYEGVFDHIIRIEAGGSKNDPRNHWMIKTYWHNKKNQLEKNKSILIETVEIENEFGEKELIPKNREDIVKVLKGE